MKNTSLALVFALAAVVAASPTQGATVLNIDFNTSGPTSNTETGFSAFTVGNNGANIANGVNSSYLVPTGATGGGSGNVTVTLNARDSGGSIAGNNFARLRGTPLDSGPFTYSDLYYDLLMGPGSSTSFAEVLLSGLAANTTYSLTVYSFDSSAPNSTFTYTNHTSGSSAPFGAITTAGSPTSNSQYSFTGNIVSSPTGTLSFWAQATAGGASGRAVINGFELATVPEPSTVGLIAAAGALLMFRRNRRRLV